jgi:hypothetical protein
MEAYLEAIDVVVIELPSKASQNLRIPPTLSVMRFTREVECKGEKCPL